MAGAVALTAAAVWAVYLSILYLVSAGSHHVIPAVAGGALALPCIATIIGGIIAAFVVDTIWEASDAP